MSDKKPEKPDAASQPRAGGDVVSKGKSVKDNNDERTPVDPPSYDDDSMPLDPPETTGGGGW